MAKAKSRRGNGSTTRHHLRITGLMISLVRVLGYVRKVCLCRHRYRSLEKKKLCRKRQPYQNERGERMTTFLRRASLSTITYQRVSKPSSSSSSNSSIEIALPIEGLLSLLMNRPL